MWIGAAGTRTAKLHGETEPTQERANPIEAENDQKQNEHGGEKDAKQRMLFLPAGESADDVLGKPAMPIACEVIPISRSALNVLREKRLVREVVIDDPFVPIELQPVQVHTEAGE